MELFTQEQRRNGREVWEEACRRADELVRKRAEREARGGRAATSAERSRKSRATLYDCGEIPRVRHPRVRAACRLDLLRFGLTYCASFLKHAPSDEMVARLILPLQRLIIGGGQECVQFPRSTGKTTWVKIAILWSILYGHKRFIVTVSATASASDVILEEVVGAFADEGGERLALDFPGIALPIAKAEANPKKVRGIKCMGDNVGMRWKGPRFVFPSCRNAEGEIIEPGAGAVFVSGSVGANIKGQVRKKMRPDFIILDDPQTRKVAESASETDKVERFIEGDVMGLPDQSSVYSVVMTITPIRLGDLSTRYADAKLHPSWHVSTAPYVLAWTPRAEDLLPAYRAAFAEDRSIGDDKWTLSRRFYADHRAEFEGVRVIDPLNFADGEADAIHHLLNMRAAMRDEAFKAEYMLDVSSETGEVALDAGEVTANLTHAPFCMLPTGTLQCVAFCDVNGRDGLRWGVLACGPKRVTAVVAYGSWPVDGRALFEPGADSATQYARISEGVREVTRAIINLPLCLPTGTRIRPRALCFDGGWAQGAVNATVAWLADNVKLHGMEIMWSIGRAWSRFDQKQKDEATMISRDHVRSSVREDKATHAVKKFLVIQTDYWREIAQKSFRTPFPQPGSCALFGADPARHAQFAEELTYERLVRTYRDDRSGKLAWEWNNTRKGHNHFADVLVGCFALARWKDIYAAAPRAAISATVVPQSGRAEWDANVSTQAPVISKPPAVRRAPAPLFRKLKRPRLVK